MITRRTLVLECWLHPLSLLGFLAHALKADLLPVDLPWYLASKCSISTIAIYRQILCQVHLCCLRPHVRGFSSWKLERKLYGSLCYAYCPLCPISVFLLLLPHFTIHLYLSYIPLFSACTWVAVCYSSFPCYTNVLRLRYFTFRWHAFSLMFGWHHSANGVITYSWAISISS